MVKDVKPFINALRNVSDELKEYADQLEQNGWDGDWEWSTVALDAQAIVYEHVYEGQGK